MYAKAYAEARERNEQIAIINLTTYDDEHPFLLKKLELDPIVCRMYKVDHITGRPRLSLSCRTADFLLRHIPSCDRLVEEGHARKYNGDQSHLSKKNLYIEGYFESWRYFDHYREDIKDSSCPPCRRSILLSKRFEAWKTAWLFISAAAILCAMAG